MEGTTFNPDAGQVVGLKGTDANLEAIAAVCSLCNEAHLECSVRPSAERPSQPVIGQIHGYKRYVRQLSCFRSRL